MYAARPRRKLLTLRTSETAALAANEEAMREGVRTMEATGEGQRHHVQPELFVTQDHVEHHGAV